jgi:hypothetical protein
MVKVDGKCDQHIYTTANTRVALKRMVFLRMIGGLRNEEHTVNRNSATRARAPHSLRFLDHTHNDTPQSVGLLWTRDRPVAGTSSLKHTPLIIERHPYPGRDFFLYSLVLCISSVLASFVFIILHFAFTYSTTQTSMLPVGFFLYSLVL